jgi:lipoprotein-releasing system ATP-binding protein
VGLAPDARRIAEEGVSGAAPPHAPGVPAPVLAVRGLVKGYPLPRGGRLEVLNGVDLSVEAGEVVALLGASGAGKSTLLHVVGSLDPPEGGRVWVDGKDLYAFNPRELARFRSRTLGFVFQFHHLLPEFSALENVMMPGRLARRPESEVRRDAEAALARVGLTARAAHLPGELSGGEAQRVAVARALVNRPRLLLADEPSGNLDRENADGLHRLLVEVAEDGPAVLVATHNERLAALADSVITLDAGRTSRREQAGRNRRTVSAEGGPNADAMPELP